MTTREAALEAALNNIRELNMTGEDENGCKWAHSDLIEQEIVFALSTPAAEPQGYVEGYCKGIDDAARRYDVMSGLDTWDYFYTAKQSMLALKDFAARPAPQPAADTRVVPVAELEQLIGLLYSEGRDSWAEDIRAIIGTATPAPSNKIAEAARKCLVILDGLVAESGRGIDYGFEDAFRMGEWFEDADLAAIEELRALAGQGETP